MSEPRTFSHIQRVEIFNRSGGHCQSCGVPIALSNFHADHIIPWSKGGKTNLSNAQALCPNCNLKKSGTMTLNYHMHMPAGFEARKWQDDFLKRFFMSALKQLNENPADIQAFILHAFPATGKTLAQCLAARTLIEHGYIDQVVILVPSKTLRKQMHEDAKLCGLHLNHKKLEVTKHGIVTTYQSLGSKSRETGAMVNAELLRKLCGEKRTMVIADEMHHLSDGKNWGEAFEFAFTQTCVVKLMTSGTPFRTDSNRLPWVRYDGRRIDLSPPHGYSYGYGTSKWNSSLSALNDEAVRDVEIFPWDGKVKFTIKHYQKGIHVEDSSYTHRISDNIDELYPDILAQGDDGKLYKVEDRKKLRAQIKSKRRLAIIECGTKNHPHGTDYVRDQLLAANDKLVSIRKIHPWASGLIVCKDCPHADAMAKALKHWTGEDSIVVHTKSSAKETAIEDFANDKTSARPKWIISVAQISEGVTIKHLRVGVYMTQIQSALRWTQILGRVLRVEKDLPWEQQTAAFYQYDDGLEMVTDEDGDQSPGDANIRLYSKTLLEERCFALESKEPKQKPIDGGGGGGVNGGNFSLVQAESASGSNDHTIYADQRYSNQELDAYQPLAIRLGWSPARVKHVIEKGGKDNWEEALERA